MDENHIRAFLYVIWSDRLKRYLGNDSSIITDDISRQIQEEAFEAYKTSPEFKYVCDKLKFSYFKLFTQEQDK